MTAEAPSEPNTEEFVGRLFAAGLGSLELVTVYVGDRLGLYKLLSQSAAMTSPEVASRSGLNERYVREWLEQQAVASILSVDDPGAAPEKRRYTLPPEHAAALVDPDSPFSIAPLARAVVSAAATMPLVLEAYRTGRGVEWSAYGPDMVESQGDFNRPWLLGQLASEFLPSVADLHARLQADPPARVLDVACGLGWSSIAIAREYPKVSVLGVDVDDASMELARRNAEEKGVGRRVRFEARDAASLGSEGPFDLAIVVEAVHDMSNPVEVLAGIRNTLAPAGSLIVADERVAESFTAPGDEIERFMYGASVLICLPCGMNQQPSAATGTVMRPATLERYAREAGFSKTTILDIEHPMLRFYRLQP